jgi:hypothetical protein
MHRICVILLHILSCIVYLFQKNWQIMKKLGLIFFSVVVLAGCDESQDELAEQKILLEDITFSPIANRLESHLTCECNGGVYLPASYELVAYD